MYSSKLLQKLPVIAGSSAVSDGNIVLNKSTDELEFSTKIKKAIQKETQTTPENWLLCQQIHGNKTIQINSPQTTKIKQKLPHCDGLLTTNPELVLIIRHADCVPVFLYNQKTKTIGLIHSGWKGTFESITPKAIAQLIKNGGTTKDIYVSIGASAKSCCYGFKNDSQWEWIKELKDWENFVTINKDWISVDLAGKIQSDCLSLGIPKAQIERSNTCTICDNSFHSYRRSKKPHNNISYIKLNN